MADLLADLRARFDGPLDRPLPEDDFNALALRVFRHQYRANAAFRRFCDGRGARPEAVEHWTDVPPVPTDAFKHVDLYSGAPGSGVGEGGPERVFRTSGTTRGAGLRGRHPIPSLDLYRAASVRWFAWNLLAGLEDRPVSVLSLVPDPARVPDSSLATMMGFVVEAVGDEHSAFLADPEGGVQVAATLRAVEAARDRGAPVLVMGTAFAWVQWLDAPEVGGRRLGLPRGSRLMETGGFKGRTRVVARDELYRDLEARLGISPASMVNEYGMTELLSQLYEPVLREGAAARGIHRPPPWLRVRALDPESLAPLPPGEVGLLAFHDLANVGSVASILTQDVGSVDADGVRLQGRAPGAEPRGCSLALEEILTGTSPP